MSAALLAARQHVAAVVERYPEAAAFDVDQWAASIAAHLEPLPVDRPWRMHVARRRPSLVGRLAPAVASTLAPPAGTQPQPRCPTACFVTHMDDDAREAG